MREKILGALELVSGAVAVAICVTGAVFLLTVAFVALI